MNQHIKLRHVDEGTCFCSVLAEIMPARFTGCDDCTKQAQQIWGSVDVNLPNLLSPSDLEQSWSSGSAHFTFRWSVVVCCLAFIVCRRVSVLHVSSMSHSSLLGAAFELCVWIVGQFCTMDFSFGSRWWYQHHRITPRWYLVMSNFHMHYQLRDLSRHIGVSHIHGSP